MAKKKIPLCTPKSLPEELHVEAAIEAISLNPVNAPSPVGIASLLATVAVSSLGEDNESPLSKARSLEDVKEDIITPARMALLTGKWWGSGGVKLTVSFMESIRADLANRIVSHLNAWNTVAGANVQFVWTQSEIGQVRISRGRGGYYSFMGVDIKYIPTNQATMNLEAITMNTPESEFIRVVRHEAGHTLGAPHEHMRRDLVAKLNVQKTIQYFMRTQGWSEQEVRAQVLTPLEEAKLLSPTQADANSIMCYQISGSCTLDGNPIPGGNDFSEWDKQYIKKVYPMPNQPPPPPQPPPGGEAKKLIIEFLGDYKILQS